MNRVSGPQLVLFSHSHSISGNLFIQRPNSEEFSHVKAKSGQNSVRRVPTKLAASRQPKDS